MHDMTEPAAIPFIDLGAQRRRLGAAVDQAVARVIDHGQYILGPEVRELESRLAAVCGARHALSCASGTDALMLVLLAQGIKPGDAVFCPSFTFCATAEVVALVGATPLFVDVEAATFNMSPQGLERGIATARRLGLRPALVIPVDLFGLPADYDAILPVAERHGLPVLSDAAQSFGATYRGRKVGTFGVATATSFFPAKPLGCYGDGGAVFTDDDALIEVLRSLRVHGMGADKYDNVRLGMTGRLDTIQAAVLIEKLKIFDDEIAARDRAAAAYSAALKDLAIVPRVPEGLTSVWAQYTLRLRPGRRDRLAADLRPQGIPTAIYYPKALHQQVAYRHFPVADGGLAVTERLVDEVISLPMHGYLDEATQGRIIEAVRRALA
ncbi:DegT/DnrJ/EryC1/StrS family aminotransferase [Blastochloris sulfoviridis]|uniref:DegT/DnrJ/EryC1/StrS family aminotransferase n=1 Tax=Blastochloris sulfoviridis TaxID=50712 RepID=A0A5M6I4Z8_9HYPH|nr:DegT/DnrJ/EryC1/StrS family aminotransferase [Blastochloris sulfoviridis]KAA5602885.1 DegT/DnrJ/EryC1/StrS family aminotransferase [Blastochloris sulfoviridis]